jgi:methylglyoxal/glyoxal reductase
MSKMELPDIGLGTYQLEPEQTYRSVRWALEIGYRHIDTAALYRNEKQVGQAIRDSGIPRQHIFVTTKILPKAIRQQQLKPAIERSLHELDLGYIDLMLLHCPGTKINQTWETLSQLYCESYQSTKIRYIGVSNYQEIHLKSLEGALVKPYANQIEVSPFLPRKQLRAYCQNQGIYPVAHSSLSKGIQLNHPQLLEIANDVKLTSAGLLLKWALQNHLKIIPRSANQKHILANFNLPTELLSEQMMQCLDNLDCGFATHPQHIE